MRKSGTPSDPKPSISRNDGGRASAAYSGPYKPEQRLKVDLYSPMGDRSNPATEWVEVLECYGGSNQLRVRRDNGEVRVISAGRVVE